MKKLIKHLSFLMALILVLSLAGCFAPVTPTEPTNAPTTQTDPAPTNPPTNHPTDAPTDAPTDPPTAPPTEAVVEYAGVVYLTVNPSFAIYYNEAGEVVKVEALNDDAAALDVDADSFQGSSCAEVVADLVEAIGEAGYLDDENTQIEISLETAEDAEPDATLDAAVYTEVTAEVNTVLSQNEWTATVTVEQNGEPIVPTEPATEPPTDPPHEHSYELTERYDASCDEDGYVVYACSCGDYYSEVTEEALGHDYEEVEYVEASCTRGYYYVYECSVCGDSYSTEPTGKFGHKFETVTVYPTMEAGGYTEYTCSVCGESYRDEYTDKIEVDFTDVNETVYTTGAVNVRKGPSTNTEIVTTLAQGIAVTRTGIGSNGWSRVTVDGETAYIYSDYLSKNDPSTEPPSGSEGEGGNSGGNDYTGGNGTEGEEYNPWDDYVHNADPYGNIDGLSWDGKSPIIYTYADGTTGTEPVVGALYELYPGYYVAYQAPIVDDRTEQEKQDAENGIFYCRYCGRLCGDDGKDGKCVRHLTADWTCPDCGVFVPVGKCHTCGVDPE